MTLRHPLASALALSALLCPLSAQQDWVTWTSVDGVSQTDQFGTAITGVGDWNGDGYDDYAVSSVGSDRTLQNAGLVTIFSGFDDSVMAEIEGIEAADQLGASLANLGTHDGDGLPKIAVGAPYASSANGVFSGLVRIYAWDDAAGTLSLVTELLGSAPGALFGSSLAAFELNGDGDLDLAVGAMGANFQDGEVSTFVMSDAGAATPASAVYAGATGSMEMFGWSLASSNTFSGGAGGVSGDDLLVGAPFADDVAVDAGAAILIDEFGTQTLLLNPFGSTANAHLGYSVAGGEDLLGDGSEDLVAGAPDTTQGDVIIWDGSDLTPAELLPGSGSGGQFGYSVLVCPDTDFDGMGDVAVGSPQALGGRGTMQVFTVAGAPSQLHSAAGPSGTNGHLGWSLGVVGDLNQTDKMEIAASAPNRDNMIGHVDIYAPPAQDIGPI
ncbi:MAG: autotransporter outer membrane beta-barrel domain-containing protein, partial [Planctomycetota bacterium]